MTSVVVIAIALLAWIPGLVHGGARTRWSRRIGVPLLVFSTVTVLGLGVFYLPAALAFLLAIRSSDADAGQQPSASANRLRRTLLWLAGLWCTWLVGQLAFHRLQGRPTAFDLDTLGAELVPIDISSSVQGLVVVVLMVAFAIGAWIPLLQKSERWRRTAGGVGLALMAFSLLTFSLPGIFYLPPAVALLVAARW